MARSTNGDETWRRLVDWINDSKAAERMSALILNSEGYASIDPSHPLGGPDGLKDIVCLSENKKWVVACYYPRGQKRFAEIKKKYLSDIKGVKKNNADGIIFVTNQELSLSEREELRKSSGKNECEIYHLERITQLLNRPENYGVRLEFLDIEMTKEEQVSYFAFKDSKIERSLNNVEETLNSIRNEFQIDSAKKQRPNLIVRFDEDAKKIFYPEKYSDVNTLKRIMNYSHLPSLPKLFNMRIVNTGINYAKDISVSISVKKDDVIVSDSNLDWMSLRPFGDFNENESDFNQNSKISYIDGRESLDNETEMPMYVQFNGVLLSSVYNVSHFIMIESESFERTREHYEKKKKQRPLLFPKFQVALNYYDSENNFYENSFSIGMKGLYQMAGEHIGIALYADFGK